MEENQIDAKGLLSKELIDLFTECHDPEDSFMIFVGEEMLDKVYKVKELKQFFIDMKEREEKDSTEVILASSAVSFVLSWKDIRMYRSRKLKELFPEEEKEKKKESKKVDKNEVICCALKYSDDEDPKNVAHFEGTRAQCVEWLNRINMIYTIRGYYKRDILISIKGSEFMSIPEAKEKGLIV